MLVRDETEREVTKTMQKLDLMYLGPGMHMTLITGKQSLQFDAEEWNKLLDLAVAGYRATGSRG